MKIIYLLFFILLFAVQTKSQTRPAPSPGSETVAIKLYPNPAISQITFDFQNGFDKNYMFQIYNFIGKKVYEQRSASPKTVVDVSDFYRGVYIYQVRDLTGKVINSGRFTKEQ